MVIAGFRHHRAFRFAALMALWAMLLPALLPLAHPAAAMMGAAQPICHMASGGAERQHPSDHGKAQPSCPICQGLGSLAQGFVTPDGLAFPAVFRLAGRAAAGAAPAFAVFTPTAAAWPRAPPALA